MSSSGENELTQTQPLEAQVERSHAKWGRLRVVHPHALCGTIKLADRSQVTTLGRAPTDDGPVKLGHKTISRNHLGLRYSTSQRAWTAKELGSRNGTWVDGVRLGEQPHALGDGSVIRLGDVLAVFEWCTGELRDADAVATAKIFGDCPRVIALREQIAAVATDPSPALIIGDTGTGKEFCAAELHRLGQRRGPLVTFNCAELSPTVVESQLFGHEKGAFTGASTAHPGLFRSADGGTLFLDEVGEIPLGLQPKLLRALQTGEVLALGGTRKHIVDVRIVAATNRNLSEEVGAGSFRRDLYARLAIHEIRVPALRRRRADLLGWIDVLARAWAERRQRDPVTIELSADAAELVLRAAWEENLRGLDRLVHAIAPLADHGPIAPAQLPAWLTTPTGESLAMDVATPEDATPVAGTPKSPAAKAPGRSPIPDQDALLATLEAHAWVIQSVARHYGRDRRQIYRWMDNHGIKRRD